MVTWHVDGIGARGRALSDLLAEDKPDVVVPLELKATSTEVLQEAWPCAGIEYIPAKRKEVRSAPRAG